MNWPDFNIPEKGNLTIVGESACRRLDSHAIVCDAFLRSPLLSTTTASERASEPVCIGLCEDEVSIVRAPGRARGYGGNDARVHAPADDVAAEREIYFEKSVHCNRARTGLAAKLLVTENVAFTTLTVPSGKRTCIALASIRPSVCPVSQVRNGVHSKWLTGGGGGARRQRIRCRPRYDGLHRGVYS